MEKKEAYLMQDALSSGSAFSIIIGIILIVISIQLIANPAISVTMLIKLLGIYLVIKGIFDFFTVFSSETKHRGLTTFVSIFGFIVGVLILMQPALASVLAATYFVWAIAIALIINGMLAMTESVALGILSIIVGLLLFFTSYVTVVTTLVLLIGFFVLLIGILSIIAGAKLNLEAKKVN